MAPNPIDFDKVFTELTRLSDTGNVAVIIAVSCVFGLYLLLLIWALKVDKLDLLKVSGFFLFKQDFFSVLEIVLKVVPLQLKKETIQNRTYNICSANNLL